ncbi:hypothetical protein TNCV_5026031 [Trichonephila clavipes]|uniref:Uncharacterized protein n=1 Tax=Trichonephila clavipes TaxID=2585209 RepID=A0A8X6RUW6_TRICX|nr:hypothetical protein TNCV_5026031 [Trichonephila clavipes]
MFQILLWSPWKYRCGQRTVRMAVMACSQNQAVFARRRSELKLKLELVEEKQKLLDIREKGERERCASRRNRDYTGMWVRLGSTDLMAVKVMFLRSNQGGRFDGNESVADSFRSDLVNFKSSCTTILGAFYSFFVCQKNPPLPGSSPATRGNRDYTGMWVRLGSTDLMAGKVMFLRSNQGGRFDGNESVADSFRSDLVNFKSSCTTILGAFYSFFVCQKNPPLPGSSPATRGQSHPSLSPSFKAK